MPQKGIVSQYLTMKVILWKTTLFVRRITFRSYCVKHNVLLLVKEGFPQYLI